jgi:hypothetical protein
MLVRWCTKKLLGDDTMGIGCCLAMAMESERSGGVESWA